MGGAEMDEKTWAEIMEDCDTNKDGMVQTIINENNFYIQISQAEFVDLLQKKFV